MAIVKACWSWTPTPAESKVIRDKIGIRKRRELDDATLAALRAHFSEQHVAA